VKIPKLSHYYYTTTVERMGAIHRTGKSRVELVRALLTLTLGKSRVDLVLSCVDNYEARITINQVRGYCHYTAHSFNPWA
jgi:hypothetical protein